MEMWDDASPVTTAVFHNTSLRNTAGEDWDAWDGSYTARRNESSNNVGNFGGFNHQHDGVWHSNADRFGQQGEAFHSSDDAAPFDMKILSRQIGLVLGKGGSRIRELQESSGAKINVKRNDIDNYGKVLVTLDGDAASRTNAKRMIDELIENDSSRPNAGRSDDVYSRQTSRRFTDGGGFHDATVLSVASNMLGAVIGRGGQKIKDIQDKTQTKIKIADDRSGETVDITITGSEDGRLRAKSMISDNVQSAGESRYVSNSERSSFNVSHTGTQHRSGFGGFDNYEATQSSHSATNSERSGFDDSRSGGQQRRGFDGFDHCEPSDRSFGNSGGSSFGSSTTRHTGQHRSGFGGFDNFEATDSSHSMPNSERSVFGDSHSRGQQRRGFDSFDHCEPKDRSFGNSGGSSFGSSATRHGFTGTVINWDHVKELSQKHEEEKWKDYPPIKKNFYIEDPDVANMDPEEVAEIRKENNNIMVNCDEDREAYIPNPVRNFDEGFLHYPDILSELKRAGFSKPSPIQMQGWPIALQGLDLIGIAQTGTGKTLAFLLPAFIHIEGQPVPREKRGGPNVLVLSPTRELALQIEQEVKKYKYRDINCVCVYGGGNRREQINIVTKGVEIVVATPGRLNDLIASNIIDVKSVTYLVLDEADRMLDLGFEPEIRKILIDIRPDRQTIMTSATWPAGVRRLATSYMSNPIRVFVGSLDLTAVHSVRQRVEVVQEEDKRERLVEFLTQEMEGDDKAIVFVGRKCTVDSISSDFALSDIRCQSIHGGREQCDREQALQDLKEGIVRILIATDVASRGIDIKDVTHIVNFDFPHNIEEYVHRIGRTGRAGRSGESLTFMTRADWRHAGELIKIMEEAKQEVPGEVYDMSQRYESMRERRRNEGPERFGGRGDFDDFSGFGDGGGRRGGRGGRRDRERSFRVAYM